MLAPVPKAQSWVLREKLRLLDLRRRCRGRREARVVSWKVRRLWLNPIAERRRNGGSGVRLAQRILVAALYALVFAASAFAEVAK